MHHIGFCKGDEATRRHSEHGSASIYTLRSGRAKRSFASVSMVIEAKFVRSSDYALSQGVKIRLGQQVTEYFENEDQAGVISNGECIVGDVVFGADGVKSKARQLVLGYDDKPEPQRLRCVPCLDEQRGAC